MGLRSLLSEPALDGVEIGSPQWFGAQRDIISARPLVRNTYERWYRTMLEDAASVPADRAGDVLEIGSGSGYVKSIDPSVITSDIVPGHADLLIDAQELPFAPRSLRAIMLTHVFHHIPDVRRFLQEAMRTLVDGGVITMIEVAHTPLSRLLFGRFHPEEYRSGVRGWDLDTSRPCGGANQALSWIVFKRDAGILAREFPDLVVEEIELLPWLGYLFSGGATRRNLIPEAFAQAILKMDAKTKPLDPFLALHWHIRVRKRLK